MKALISDHEPFFVSVSLLCFQLFTVKLILRPKMGRTYSISSKLDFSENFITNQFLLFFMDFRLLKYHNNIVKFTEF